MSTSAAMKEASAVRRRKPWLGARIQGPLAEAGEMVQLLGEVLWSAIRHPIGYWHDVRDQMYSLLKLCWAPMAISTVAFGLGAPGIQGGNIFHLFGIPERLGSFFIMASVREFAPWINAMVVAGVVGTAMTADLGARRIREEIDAMEVLGVDPIRDLILPRVIAVTIMTGLMDLVALVFGVVGGYIAGVWVLGANSGAFFNSFFDNATTPDIWGSVVKTTIFGLIIGVVCCYKGLHARGGPNGVGRAVNQAVVSAFAAIWVIDYVFTTILLGLNPQMQVYR
ncbi:ABC transporter permease [Streptomyces sp. RB6PN25]|uniref:ABC transporter permease n=1 Tax=Streptomyces humicola TaxID=2953240 RepID=A0ABT1PNE8_9ACTN|nr:ABC transporter permease [Streptomyces humicola]MCQ4079203.1 ABC transporter permease [Streptomyces humicola]